MPSRPTLPPAASDGDEPVLRSKLADLVARQRYSEAIRVREQALRRRPELDLKPSEARLWCLEGQQAAAAGQAKRAEGAFRKAMALGLNGEPLERLARLWLEQGDTPKALALLEEEFTAGRLPTARAGAYLKVLFLAGEAERARVLIRDQPRRFQVHQLQWAAGVLSLMEGNPATARRHFANVVGPVTLGDHGAVWRAWASLEAGDNAGATAALKGVDHPAAAALALDLAARTDQPPANLLDLSRRDLPRRDDALALALLHHLRQGNLLSAAQLLLANERSLLATLPELAPLRRPLLLLAGQQALEREDPGEAITCWRLIVDRPGFDPDLALRLYPLLDASADEQHMREAERLAGQLLAWLRRVARASPSAWPEPLLSTTLARLHCWQVDQWLQLGERQRARRGVEEAQRLAPGLPDVMGRQGLLACLGGDNTTAIPLLWQALEGGSESRFLYEVLEEVLESTGQEAEAVRLRRQQGPRFGAMAETVLEPDGMVPAWLEALSRPDLPAMASTLRNATEPGAGLNALRVFLEHVSLPTGSADGASARSSPGKVPLALPEASDRWDALLSPQPPADQVEALTAILVAIQRFCRRAGKAIASQRTLRLAQLEAQASSVDTAAGEGALQSLLLLHGLGLKRSEAPGPEAARLLRCAPQPHRTLPLALLDLRLFTSTKSWRPLVEDLRRQEPHNPLLTLALATMERTGSFTYGQLSGEAFDQARRQQDGVALAACRREEWRAETHPERPRGRPMGLRAGLDWDRLCDTLDFESILRSVVRDRGMGEISDEEMSRMLPEIAPQVRRAMAQMAGDDPDAAGFQPPAEESEPPPRPRDRSRRRTFMDL